MFFCFFCNGPIQPGERVDHELTAWERKGFGGSRRGGSDVVLREQTGRVAHSRCVDREKSGIGAGQESLI